MDAILIKPLQPARETSFGAEREEIRPLISPARKTAKFCDKIIDFGKKYTKLLKNKNNLILE
jgi:hypothetical protein